MFKYDFTEGDVQNIMKELWLFKCNDLQETNSGTLPTVPSDI